jgi:hypothetical protein
MALKWTFSTTALAFLIMFLTPLAIGGPGAHQGPLLAFVLIPIIFVITLALTLVWPRLGLITIAASLLFPVWYYVNRPPRDPQSALVPLNAEERALVRSRHFELRVAVDAGRFPPIYKTRLIDDLGRTGLFSAVGSMEDVHSPDLIAVVAGSYYGDKTGHSFVLTWPQAPERSVSVKLWHYASDGPLLYASRHRLQVERLALEIVRQMDALGPSAQAADKTSSEQAGITEARIELAHWSRGCCVALTKNR